MTAEPVVLVISTGSQDVKFIAKRETSGTTSYAELLVAKPHNKSVHDWLVDNPGGWQWADAGLPEQNFATDNQTTVAFDQSLPVIEPPAGASGTVAWQLSWGDSAHLHLRAAKLTRLAQALQQMQKEGELNICGALVFGTDRSGVYSRDKPPRKAEFEPRQSHRLVAQWLAELWFGDASRARLCRKAEDFRKTQGQPPCIYYVNAAEQMRGTSHFDFEGDKADYPLKRRITKHIDQCIKAFFQGRETVTALSSATGGPDAIRSVIAASTQLRSGGRSLDISQTEREKSVDNIKERLRARLQGGSAAHYAPSEILLTRHRVLERIRHGDFEGAWAVCANLSPDSADTHWVTAVSWVKEYFQHGRVGGLEQQCDDWLDHASCKAAVKLAKCLQGLVAGDTLQQQIDRALTLVAFRVEAALTIKDCSASGEAERQLERALIATSTFNDLLFSAATHQWLQIALQEKCPGEPTIIFGDKIEGCPNGVLPYDLTAQWTNKKGATVEATARVVNAEGRIKPIAGPELPMVWWHTLAADNIAKRFDGRWRAEIGIDQVKLAAVQLRNRLAHQMLDENHRQAILQVMTEEHEGIALWNSGLADGVVVGQAFLATPLLKTIEEQFELASMGGRYFELVDSLMRIVAAPILCR